MTSLSHPLSASSRNGLVVLIIGAIAIGLAPIFVRVSEVGPSATAFWRLTLAFPVLYALSLSSSSRRRDKTTATENTKGKSRGAWLPVAAGVFFACDLAVWHRSIHYTTIANATLLTNLSAVFVPLFAWLFFRQRITSRFIFALAVALFGTLLLAGKNAHFSTQTLKGDGLAILAALFYTGYIFIVKEARDREQSTSSIMAVSALVTAVLTLPLALLTNEKILPESLLGWGTLLGLAGVSHLAGQSMITHALAKLPATIVSLGLLLQPATATLVAWAWLHEALSPIQLLGAIILLLGLILVRSK